MLSSVFFILSGYSVIKSETFCLFLLSEIHKYKINSLTIDLIKNKFRNNDIAFFDDSFLIEAVWNRV